MTGRFVAGWLLPVCLPLAGLGLLLVLPAADVHYQHHGAHFWIVLATSAVALALAVVMLRAVRRRQDARLFLVALVFQLNAGFLGVHALATPGLLIPESNAGFVSATPVGLVLGGIAALASAAPLGPAAATRVMRCQTPLAATPWLLLGVWTALTFARVPPLHLHPDEIETHPLVAGGVVVGAGLYLAAAVRYLDVYRQRRSPLLLAVLTAFVLLAETLVAVALSRSWRVSWWEWHVLMVAAFALITLSAHRQFRREGSGLGLFDSVTLRQTLAAIHGDYSRALEEMVEAVRRRAEPGADVGTDLSADVARRFQLTERQVAILQESAEALGREREQVRRLHALVAIGERASVIRGERELLSEVMALATGAFRGDAVRLGLVRSGLLAFADGRPARDGIAVRALRELRPRCSADGATFVLPLAVKRAAAGVLEVHRPRGAFPEAERAVLTSLASQLSVTLENARLYAQLDGLFRSYMSPSVATALLSDPEQAGLGGRVAEVSVLMADLRGFTPFSERSSPEAVVAMLNTYYGAVVPVILEHGGTVVQFVGDAVMAIFNAPVRQPDHALRAARAGLGLHCAVETVAAGRSDWPRFRVGINTGPALVGNIGAAQMRNFTAIGDTTNLAARLEAIAEPGQVVIGAATMRQLGPLARTGGRRAVRVAGKRDPVTCTVLEGIEPAVARA
ncbi:class 3 adenylate cyclase [Pseudonocardia hierapolitana]|uniref:Class 3 adenylate cyclase n=1 Tax=Pseudonocardia hierapolitana TaxID=1128676 RepID=A0A561SHZ8_9PSEU|nr:adenylate/guanylate cyclase domain-containing protein [Pseudonocardia hierapolitana]TWF74432.1 class 3 adenylate cyclase [Pseudonocardia hierapolitana]